jgi:hypothetical protein
MSQSFVNPSSRQTPALRAVPMNLFPTLGSLQEVVDLAESKLPITDKNEMFSLLMSYHNTLLATQKCS